MKKICLVIFLLTFLTISEKSYAISTPVKWWCGNHGVPVICEMRDGIVQLPKEELLLHQFFGDVENEARAVAKCESNFNNSAIGKAGEIGIFQIHPVHFKEVESLGLDLHTLEGNFAYSRILFGRNKWKDWSCAKILGIIK